MKNLKPWQDPNFIDVTEALNDLKTPYYICAGTLLRLHRDGHLSPNGGDIDVWFPQDSIDPQMAVVLLENLGFETNWAAPQNLHGYRDGGRFIDFEFPFTAVRQTPSGIRVPHEIISWEVPKFYRLAASRDRLKNVAKGGSAPEEAYKKFAAKALYVGLRPLRKMLTEHRNPTRLQHKMKRVEYRIPSSFVEHLEEVHMGEAFWYQPSEVEPVLESLYGVDWRTPRSRRIWFEFAKNAPE